MLRKFFSTKNIKKFIYLGLLGAFLLGGVFLLWITTVELPNINNFENRIVAESTKIYDRTGKVVLFDVHGNVRRTVVPMEKISDYVKWATIAIEDDNFYNHKGIEPKAILRAIFVNIKEGDLFGGQGGSTITQQVIKNSLLTTDKKVTRKIKEWILAPRLEAQLSKDEILEIYLNEVPYGGTVYGVQEASRRFFGKDSSELSLVESSYIAALPQAPTFYSPYGNNLEALESRKNKVLKRMLEEGFITEQEYEEAMQDVVEFEKQEDYGIKAPHFVMYIREQIEEKYGPDVVEQGGLKVITTLDWDLQKDAEELVSEWALKNEQEHGAENASITAVDPKTGQILVMVGSRDYFDQEIDGAFNISTAKRQPGSAFKPFVYAAAFDKGYRPETVVFDLPTEFSVTCSQGGNCYNPSNYDGKFRGPISLRDALAQSINIPAVKVLYLAGLNNSLEIAKKMGIETLTNPKQYGLTLVLGGGEVRPLDMAAAYSVFANGGYKNEVSGILKIEDKEGNVLEEFEQKTTRVLNDQTTKMINSVLSDNNARAPMFGANSWLNFSGLDVAAKTGTTNNYRDAWIIGYTPAISVSAWAGNNDNRSMQKKPAASIVAPMWNQFMRKAIEKYPAGGFTEPNPQTEDVKPIIAGAWNIDGQVHSILHWVDKDNPLSGVPNNPQNDPQYNLWEQPVRMWSQNADITTIINSQETKPSVRIVSPEEGKNYIKTLEIFVAAYFENGTIQSGKVYLNNEYIGELDPTNGVFSFVPSKENSAKENNTIKVTIEDTLGNTYEDEVGFTLSN